MAAAILLFQLILAYPFETYRHIFIIIHCTNSGKHIIQGVQAKEKHLTVLLSSVAGATITNHHI